MTTRAPESLLKTRRSLIARLKNWDDQDIWREFLDRYWRLIHSVAIQSGLTETEAQDAVQETVISVAKSMPSFKYKPEVCSFKTWLLHLAKKRIIDQFRKRQKGGNAWLPRTGTSLTAAVHHIPDPRSLDLDSVWETEWQRYIFEAAVAVVRTKVAAEQFQIFDFYVLRNWPVKKVTATLGVSTSQVYLAKFRVLRLIKQAAKQLEKGGV